ncbi:MAG: hypothetical protein E6G08_00330 [Actinobacteria bacterium]|nr:MAG: hypothetical protein E6G08_00330 [Actinomycetota bacterium]
MIVRPVIGQWEVPRIERIQTLEERRIARLPVPGLLGDIQQDLGAASLTVEISGSLHGDEARDDFLQSLRESFRAGDPVSFAADITNAAELDRVLIDELELEEVNDSADGFHYRVVLREYVEPPQPPPAVDDLGLDLGGDLDSLASLGLDGLNLPDLLGGVPDIANPVPPLQGALEAVQSATSQVPDALQGLASVFTG